MSEQPLDFKSKEAFKQWLKMNATQKRVKVFIYKKAYAHLGIGYEEAVQAALCYGWIDSVTRSYNEEKFIQVFSPRRAKSNWSLSNLKRVKLLIETGEMPEERLCYFDVNWLSQLDDLIAAEEQKMSEKTIVPDYVVEIFKGQQMWGVFMALSPSKQRMYLGYIEAAKRQETKEGRVLKVIELLKGGKNNL